MGHDRFAAHHSKRGLCRRQRDRFAAKGEGEKGLAEKFHDFTATHYRRQRVTVGEGFPETRHVRRHAEVFLRSSQSKTKACDYLVEDEQCAFSPRNLLHAFQEAIVGQS